MVVLTLVSKGNSARSFPYHGLLGLSDVTLCGTVRTKLEEDKRPIEASSVVVRLRCYETIGSSGAGPQGSTSSGSSSNSGGSHASTSKSAYNPTYASSNGASGSGQGGAASTSTMTELLKGQNNGKGRVLYEKSVKVWSAARENAKARKSQESSSEGGNSPPPHRYPPKAKETEYADLGDFQKAWRLVIPPEAVRQGAKSTMIFKTWRIWWALEAVISHKPSGIHGDRMVKSHQVALLNYASPDAAATPMHFSSAILSDPRLDYDITCASTAIGSSDPFQINVAICRRARAEAAKRVTLELRREICYAQDVADAALGEGAQKTGKTSCRTHKRTASDSSIGISRSGTQEALMAGQRPPVDRHITPPQQIPTPMERDETGVTSFFDTFEPAVASVRPAGYMKMSSSIPPPLPAPVSSLRHGKREDVSLATFEADVNLNNEGVWSGKVTGNMPRAKSLYHYALGESCETASASSRFYVIVRIHFRQRGSVLELPQRTLVFTTVSAEERAKAVEQLPRIRAIQAAEAKLFSHRRATASDTDGDVKMDSHGEGAGEGTRPSTRRRSEQPESADDAPRRRMRYGSVPNQPSPVLASPTIASPNLSIASSATQRPRTAGSRRMASTNASLRTQRPKSSGGWSTSSASIRSTPSMPSMGGMHSSSPSASNPFAYAPSPTSSPLLQVSGPEPAGLFANFAGFTLKPPAEGLARRHRQVVEEVPPKPGVGRSRKRSEKKADDPLFSYQPPVLLSQSEPALISVSLTTTSSRSSETDSSSRSSPPAMAEHSLDSGHAVSKDLARSPSKTPSTTDSHNGSGQTLLGRRKSSMPLGFSFFRRGSKRNDC